MHKITIVIPCHNESESLSGLLAELNEVAASLRKHSFEYIFINDGSTDDTIDKLKILNDQFKEIHYINFSRNFGKEAATTAGIERATGDAVICIDGDGQHPPSLIKDLVAKWEEGAEVVVGVRTQNKNEGSIKKYGSKLFYWLLHSIDESDTIPGSTDYRLIDRKVANEFRKLTERNRITRGLIDWLGFKREYVYFEARERLHGTAGYSFRKLLRLAMHSFVSQSTKPLKFTGGLGLFITVLSTIAALFFIIEMYILGDPIGLNLSGTALLGILTTLLMGIVLVCQGLLALYIESIHMETQNRPLYIISEEDK